MIKKIIKIIAGVLEVNESEINSNTLLSSLGIDSLDAVEMIMAIENEFDIIIPDELADEKISQMNTVGDVCRELKYYVENEETEKVKYNTISNDINVFVDGEFVELTEESKIKKAKTIKVTGKLNDKVGELLRQCLKMREVAVLDLSEAVVDDHLCMEYYGFGREVVIPNNCKFVSLSVGYHCKRRTQAFVATADNPYCMTIDGVVYTKDGDVLIAYPPAKKVKTFTLPSEVEMIGYYGDAFREAKYLEELIINDGCLIINRGAIMVMNALRRIDFGHTVQTLVDGALIKCDALEEITLPASLIEYEEDAICCNGLKRINVVEGCEMFCSIDGVLYNKKTFALVTCPRNWQSGTLRIPEGVKTILPHSIWGCKNLKHLHLPKSLDVMEYDAIYLCENIEVVTVEEANEHFCVVGGILYNTDKTRLIYCPPNLGVKEIVVPDTVERIESLAFYGNPNICKLTIPDSVMEVGAFFLFCSNIKDLWLPKVPPAMTNGYSTVGYEQHLGIPYKGKGTKLHIPSGSIALYEADKIWSRWRARFVES